MGTKFLGKEYVALLLINAKKQIFQENFITISEYNQFEHFLQQEFNNRDLNVVITSNPLSYEDFNEANGIITASDTCCFSLALLPIDVLTILYDSNLVIDFLIGLEKQRLENLEKAKGTVLKLFKSQS